MKKIPYEFLSWIVLVGSVVVVVIWLSRDDAKSIHRAMMKGPASDEEIIQRIKDYGDVEGVHANRSFLDRAIATDRSVVAIWLLENGASPNPRGVSPLFSALVAEDRQMALRLLNAGTSWSAMVSPDSKSTVRAWAEKERPELLQQLPQ